MVRKDEEENLPSKQGHQLTQLAPAENQGQLGPDQILHAVCACASPQLRWLDTQRERAMLAARHGQCARRHAGGCRGLAGFLLALCLLCGADPGQLV